MIKGLTDRGGMLPEIGQLRKGAPAKTMQKGNKQIRTYGADLDHFRFDTQDADALASFEAEYGKEPREVKVMLPFPSVDENFDAWREAWSASSLQHRCDGLKTVIWQDKQGKFHPSPDEQVSCPGGCKPVGRLKVIIPALRRYAFVTAGTTSVHDIMNLNAQLTALQETVGTLRGIPLVLKRVKRAISTPSGSGDGAVRARREKWLLSVEPEPQWAAMMMAAYEEAAKIALSGAHLQQLALPAPPAGLPSVAPDFDAEGEIETEYDGFQETAPEEESESEKVANIQSRLRSQWPADKDPNEFYEIWFREFAPLRTAAEIEAKLAARAAERTKRKGDSGKLIDPQAPLTPAETISDPAELARLNLAEVIERELTTLEKTGVAVEDLQSLTLSYTKGELIDELPLDVLQAFAQDLQKMATVARAQPPKAEVPV